jgi:tetratricopeptide (TPR) repeat protein
MPALHEIYDEGDRLKDEGKLEEAVAKFQEILDQDESYALAHCALAVVLQKLGRHDDAINHAKRVCELEPDDPISHAQLSVTFQRAYAGTNEQRYIQEAEDAMARSHTARGGGH